MIADTDLDGNLEIVTSGPACVTPACTSDHRRVAVYEYDGNDSYVKTYDQGMPGVTTSQSLEVANDLDGDGRDEILYGGLAPGTAKVFIIESIADDAYEIVSDYDLIYTDGQKINVSVIRDAGDLDGDARREFLAGGLKTIGGQGDR